MGVFCFLLVELMVEWVWDSIIRRVFRIFLFFNGSCGE